MTTFWSDMSQVLVPIKVNGSNRAAQGLKAAGSSWTQAVIEHVDEAVRDLSGRQRIVAAIPVTHPVQRPRQRERGHLGIALANGAVLDAFFDELAHALIDLGFERLDAFAHRGAQVLLFHRDHAPAELRSDDLGITAHERDD